MKKLTAAKIKKLSKDVVAFAEEIILRTPDDKPGKLTPEQKEMLVLMSKKGINDFGEASRQGGTTTAIIIHAIHSIIFGESKTVVICDGNLRTGFAKLESLKVVYHNLPDELKHEVVCSNNGEFALANDCRVLVVSRSNHCRGLRIQTLYIDTIPETATIFQDLSMFEGTVSGCVFIARLASVVSQDA